jgi:hypothetical protein
MVKAGLADLTSAEPAIENLAALAVTGALECAK